MIAAHLLSAITIPDIALLLVLFGILLLYAEFNRPGTILLACLGTLSFTLGLYGLAHHPLSRPALALILTGLTVLLLELCYPVRFLLAIAGAVLLTLGLAILTPGIHLASAAATSAIFTAVTIYLGRVALQARRNKRIPIRPTR